MNIDTIKEIVNNDIASTEAKERMIIVHLASDSNAIIDILSLLNIERRRQQELIVDLNFEVSRYHTMITHPKLLKGSKEFLNSETKTLYEKWKGFISPLFNNKF